MLNIFQGKRVRLRAVEPSDWEIFHNSDRDNTESGRLTDEIWFPRPAEASQAWALGESTRGAVNDAFRFMIETLDGALVGTINTHECNLRCGTFRYGLGILPEHQRRGYGSEAIRLVLRYFFHERRYQKCNVEVFSFNEPSIRLHEQLGFTLEGRLRRMIYSGGDYHDSLIYGLTKEEFDTQEQI